MVVTGDIVRADVCDERTRNLSNYRRATLDAVRSDLNHRAFDGIAKRSTSRRENVSEWRVCGASGGAVRAGAAFPKPKMRLRTKPMIATATSKKGQVHSPTWSSMASPKTMTRYSMRGR